VKNAEALGVKGQFNVDNRKVKVKEMALPKERPVGRKLDGDADAQVKQLLDLLRTEARVI
jgi:electron transfer flavoprotein alpha/beta subunit